VFVDAQTRRKIRGALDPKMLHISFALGDVLIKKHLTMD
jgi:hypothetical protein